MIEPKNSVQKFVTISEDARYNWIMRKDVFVTKEERELFRDILKQRLHNGV